MRQIAATQDVPPEKRGTASATRQKDTLGTVLKTLNARERQGLYRRVLATVVVRQGRVMDVQTQTGKEAESSQASQER